MLKNLSDLDPKIAGPAIADGLEYLKNRWEWSGTKIAHVLHLPPDTLITWLTTRHPQLNAIPEKLMAESIEGLLFVRQYLEYARAKDA